MSFSRWLGGDPESVRTGPVAPLDGEHELRLARSSRLATGTLACPACDAPVLPGPAPLAPTDAASCPYCRHAGAVRDFLSLADPARPARVAVRVRRPA